MVVALTCKRVDSLIIVGSKLVWEELNGRACVIDALGLRGEGAYVTAICQDFPDASISMDLAMCSSSSRSELFATRS